jgi:hypothetical protein
MQRLGQFMRREDAGPCLNKVVASHISYVSERDYPEFS